MQRLKKSPFIYIKTGFFYCQKFKKIKPLITDLILLFFLLNVDNLTLLNSQKKHLKLPVFSIFVRLKILEEKQI